MEIFGIALYGCLMLYVHRHTLFRPKTSSTEPELQIINVSVDTDVQESQANLCSCYDLIETADKAVQTVELHTPKPHRVWDYFSHK